MGAEEKKHKQIIIEKNVFWAGGMLKTMNQQQTVNL